MMAWSFNYEFVDNAIFDGLNQVCREIIKDRADSGLAYSRGFYIRFSGKSAVKQTCQEDQKNSGVPS